jgi:hypothetical protein
VYSAAAIPPPSLPLGRDRPNDCRANRGYGTAHLCQAASGKNSAALSASPASPIQASEMGAFASRRAGFVILSWRGFSPWRTSGRHRRLKGGDTGGRHQAPAYLITTNDGQQTAMQDDDLFAQCPHQLKLSGLLCCQIARLGALQNFIT